MVRLLFIAPYTRGSGNRTTADRIASFVQPLVEEVAIIGTGLEVYEILAPQRS